MNFDQPARDLQGAGTPESVWADCHLAERLPQWQPEQPANGRVIVVAPHPDDEILGAGGTVARLSRAGAFVELIAVTDGERSHPGMESHLRCVRPRESLAAAGRLGIRFRSIRRLRHPDGRIDEPTLARSLAELVGPGDLVLAPWVCDGHPDHDATGRAAAQACARNGADLLAYLVWAWHWAKPDDLPWSRAQRVDISDLVAPKRSAAGCFRSQIKVEAVVLPPHVLRRLVRPYEVLLRQ